MKLPLQMVTDSQISYVYEACDIVRSRGRSENFGTRGLQMALWKFTYWGVACSATYCLTWAMFGMVVTNALQFQHAKFHNFLPYWSRGCPWLPLHQKNNNTTNNNRFYWVTVLYLFCIKPQFTPRFFFFFLVVRFIFRSVLYHNKTTVERLFS